MFNAGEALELTERSKGIAEMEYRLCVKEIKHRASFGLRVGYENVTSYSVIDDLEKGGFKVTRVYEGDKSCPVLHLLKQGPLYKIEW